MPEGTPVRVTWYRSLVRAATWDVPTYAHARASVLAASAAARTIRSRYTGTLARDLSRPRFFGPLRSVVGSKRRYARIEAHGGEIRARNRPRMLIRGRRIGAGGQETRSSFGADIVASAEVVYHRGKHWDAVAIATFREAWYAAAREAWSRKVGGSFSRVP